MKNLTNNNDIVKYDTLPDIDKFKPDDIFEFNKMVFKVTEPGKATIIACTGEIENELYIPNFVNNIIEGTFAYFDDEKYQFISLLDKCDSVSLPRDLFSDENIEKQGYNILNNFFTDCEMARKYNAGPKNFEWRNAGENGETLFFHRDMKRYLFNIETMAHFGIIDNIYINLEKDNPYGFTHVHASDEFEAMINDYDMDSCFVVSELDRSGQMYKCFINYVHRILIILEAFGKRNMSELSGCLHPIFMSPERKMYRLLELCFEHMDKPNREEIIVEQFNVYANEWYKKLLREKIN